MAEINQFSIIQAFTALFEIKDKYMASVSNMILNLIKMNKIGIQLTQGSKISRKFEFLEQIQCDFDISESCKSLDNRELFYLCYG